MNIVEYVIYLVPYDLHSCVIICHPNMLHYLQESIPITLPTFTTEYEEDRNETIISHAMCLFKYVYIILYYYVIIWVIRCNCVIEVAFCTSCFRQLAHLTSLKLQ